MSDTAKGPNATKADKNPKGGLSAAGRKKFGVQKGVTNYSGASRKDKGRWVSWAMRFTGTPKPVKDDKGQPTRYALMFRAWGEKVPTSAADVRAVHAKAVTRSKQLKNADKASEEVLSFADMTDDFAEDLECSDCDRSFLVFMGLLNHIDSVHLDGVNDSIEEASMASRNVTTSAAHDQAMVDRIMRIARRKAGSDLAGLGIVHTVLDCAECHRTFRGLDALRDHAEAVHTFDDIRRLVREAVAEKYEKDGDYKATPPVPSIWTYVEDLSTDWVVYHRSEGAQGGLYKASYSIVDGTVTLGEETEVVRRTVYEPVKKAASE